MQKSYSPYLRKPSSVLPKGGRGKKALKIALGILLGFFILFYLWLGPLRFFVNHYLGLTFFAKNYLILLQNNYESRPGGGFITAYGNLDTLFGFPRNLEFHNSYDIDTQNYETPPYPQEEFLKNEWYQGYTFRDANWEGNFPDSAKPLTDFYQQKFPEADVDGIIVINFSLIERLVDAFGGIELQGKELTSRNLFSEMEFTVNNVDRHSVEALGSRKNILGELAQVLTGKMKWSPGITKHVVQEGLKNKDLYLWLKSERLQKGIEKRGWGNALSLPESSDFLAVNLANLGARKADRYMTREVYHTVNLTKEVPEVTLEVTIRFPGFTNSYSDNYKGYLRVYIPGEATVEETPIESRTERTGDLSSIGSKIVIPAGSKTTLSYRFTLPRIFFEENQYRLRLVKQSGNDTFYQVVVETPRDSLIQSEDFETRENRAFFRNFLTSDRDLSLRVAADTSPPYPIEQVFENLNTIKIHWNEPLDPTSASDALNYTLWDSNAVNQATDEAKVVYVEQEGNVTKLELQGAVRQNLEQYKLELKNLRDLAGNPIFPEPKMITVVQRFEENAPEL